LLHKCSKDAIGLDLKVDFVNAFYMVHEVPDGSKLIQEIQGILKPGGLFFFCEPKFHVPRKDFVNTVRFAESIGLKIIDQPAIFMSQLYLWWAMWGTGQKKFYLIKRRGFQFLVTEESANSEIKNIKTGIANIFIRILQPRSQ
jgi:SAM-dependent methyltransferase